MAPGGGGKRKRPERTYTHEGREDGSRPSPHRPEGLNLGQQNAQQQPQQSQMYGRDHYDQRGGGRRRPGRGGRGGGIQRSPLNSPNAIPVPSRPNTASSNPMSPTLLPSQPSSETKPESGSHQPSANVAPIQSTGTKPANPALYYYEYVTDEKLAVWGHTGKEDITRTAVQARVAEDALGLGIIYQEIVRSGLDGRLDATEAGNLVREIVGPETNTGTFSGAMNDKTTFDASSLFLDCLSIIAEASNEGTSLRTLVFSTGISPQKMRLELDSTLLESLGMIRSTFVRVGIRQQTNLLYRQSNYNLLREETEGYSKLVTELFTTSNNEPPTSEVVEETFERVKGMIGAFDLDVGRVLDITLDVFAAVLVKQYRFFVKYLRASSWWPQEKAIREYASDDILSPLPRWALPGSSGYTMNDEDREAVIRHRAQRDQDFWQRTKEVGMAVFFEIGGRKAEETALSKAIKNSSSDSSKDEEDRKWIEITKTLPPSGNKVAAQVLGFKLRFYSLSARDPADVLPVNLIYLAALLIKIGFISLRDLYPHIWPADPAMDSVREEKMKEKAEKDRLNRPGGGAANALMSAAPLPDDTLEGKAREAARRGELEAAKRNAAKVDQTTERSTPVAQPEEKAEELPEPSEQKVQLLKSLLCIGALPEALYMLGRFPWLPDAFPELPEHIHRILHHCLSEVYEPLRPLKDQASLREQQKFPDPDQSSAIKGHIKLVDAPPRKVLRWAQLDKEDTSEAIDYKFYWDDWADNIPVCQTVDDVFTLCSTLLNLTGVKIGQDPALLLKLARIGHYSLATDNSDSNLARWIDLSKRLLLPALSLTNENPGVVNEMFELIKHFSTATRYNLYAEWYTGQISRQPDIKNAFDHTKAETKDVLKRISKTTVKPMARALSKTAYSSPGIVFSVAIAQLESYENIVDTVVECARYFTDLAYDVLVWSLMSALGGTGRTRVQADGMLTSKWLAALSLFAGKVFKRYSVMNPTPIIQYVAEQLRLGNSTDLIILEEMTRSMAGIISDTNFNEAQVQAMGGGDVLQAQTILQLLDRRHESKTTAKRLIKSLTGSRLAGQIAVSLAQERQTAVFRIEEHNAHPKLLGNLFDQLHRILVQYLELLRSNLSVKEFDNFVPDVRRLIREFGIDPSIAFWISRPSLAAAVAEYDAKNGKQTSDLRLSPAKEAPEIEPKDEANAATEPRESNLLNANGSRVDTKEMTDELEDKMELSEMPTNGMTELENGKIEMRDTNEESSAAKPPKAVKSEAIQQPWHPVMQEVMDGIRPALPKETWGILSFYVTFWQYALPDMHVPLQSYDDELSRQKRKVLAINTDRSDISIAGTRRKDQEKKALAELQERLRAESKERVLIYQHQRNRIMKEKEYWFPDAWGKWDDLNVTLIEHCFFPRIIISPVDALYTFKMLKFLHGSGTTNFRTMGVFDQFFREKKLTSMMFLCSAKEAECLGRFLNEVLRDFGRWHSDKAIFEKEAYGLKRDLPGFCKKMTKDKTNLAFLDFEEFRRLLLKWHRALNTAIRNCVGSGEYMHVRNAINILNHVHQNFPVVNWMGQSLLSSVTELSRTETREDLKVAATSLIGGLKRKEKDWVLPQAFNLAPTDNNATSTNGVRSASTKPSTPLPDAEASKNLNPKAPEFHPSPQSSVNGVAKPVGTTSEKVEAEDGEIEDAKMVDAPAIEASTPIAANPVKAGDDSKEANEPAQAVATRSRKQSPAPEQSHSLRVESSPSASKLEVKPTTLSQASVPGRPEVTRNSSSASGNGRVQHNLPNKPEVPTPRVPDHRIPPRASDRGTHDYARDARFPERGGPRDLRDRGQERSVSGPHPHGHERPGERSQQLDRDRWATEQALLGRSGIEDRYGAPSSRETRPLHRDDRQERPPLDRTYPEHHQGRRDTELSGQHMREPAMPPPLSNIPQHPDRAALIHGQGPDRAHPLNNPPDRRSEVSRHDHHGHSERGSRGPSPIRADDRRPGRYDNRRDERPLNDGRRPMNEPARQNTGRNDEPHAPTGPRTGRQSNTGPLNPNDRFRETMKPSSAVPPQDPNHGRLSHETNFSSRQAESQYGRLNPDSDIPSGPRLSNGNQGPRGGRNVSAPQPQLNTQQPPVSSQNPTSGTPAQERPTPSGPRKLSTFPQGAATSSGPSTPVAETAGIHPDRLKAIQGTGPVVAENSPQIHNEQGRGPRPPPVSMGTGPPRGPNNQLPSPVGPSAPNRGPPTGPSMSNDRNSRDKRFAGLQTVLQQGGTPNAPERSGQGASIRGRGGRANNVNIPSPSTSGPPTPGIPRPDQLSSQDLFAGRPSGPMASQPNEDEIPYGRGRRGVPRDVPREAERRSGRHRSRSAGMERSAGAPIRSRDEDVTQRDGPRDRPRGYEGPPERDMRGGAAQPETNARVGGVADRDSRDRAAPRDTRRSGREEAQYREREGAERRDERDRREGAGSGRKRGRGGEEVAAERSFSESKRPRR